MTPIKERIRICEKFALSIHEATEYFGIGRDQLYRLVRIPDAPYILRIGRTTLIKREMFEKYLEKITDLKKIA